MKPSHLGLILTPGDPTLSPDGRTAVVAVSRADLDVDDYTSQLWLVPTDGAAPPRQLTHGWQDSDPRWSPDGAWIAFVRSERDPDGKVGRGQLWLLPTAGGEPRRLTDHPLGVAAPVWRPDSTQLAYPARARGEGRYGSVEGVGPDKEPPRRITTLMYRHDGLGFRGARRSHVWTVDVDAAPVKPGEEGGPRQLTSGDFDHDEPDWSPDGALLTFTAARHANAGNDLRSDVFVCAADGSDLRQLTSGGRQLSNARFGADGATVYFTASTDSDAISMVVASESVWSVPLAGGAATRVTDEERHNLALSGGIQPVADGVLVPVENRGAVDLLLFGPDGGEPTVLLSGERQVIGFDRAGDTLVATVVTPTSWGELLVRDAAGERVLTNFTSRYAEQVPVLAQRELTGTAPDGYPVHGWVVSPPGPGPHPVLLMIHGGPFTQYGWRLFDEAQVYAGAGYAVVMGNPRGSSGYGQAHGQAIRGNVGEVSTVDLMALLDAALADPALDAARVGVLGGSHGGFMTSWLAAHEGDRFGAAVSERAVNAIDSFTGSSDIGWFFADDLYGPDPDQQRAQSPLTYADKIDIPVLIIHSEQDWRCPVEQAQRLFVTLRKRGVESELLLFPGEGHELSRSGLPSHRTARFDAILDWFNRHL